MLIREGIRLSGLVRVWVQKWDRDDRTGLWHPTGEPELDLEIENLITNVWKNAVRDVYRGSVADSKLRHLETGTSNVAVNAAHTALQAASFRKAVTSYAAGATGVVTTTTYIAPGESNIAIEELGWFGTPTSAAGLGTGVMTSRVLYTRNKVNTESLQIDRVDTVA